MKEEEGFEEDRASCLRNRIVRRQLQRRSDVYEQRLRGAMSDFSEKGRTIVTCIGNFFQFCEYSTGATGGIPFFREMDFLRNYFLMEQMLSGLRFELKYEDEAHTFSIPPFTVFPLVREAALNLIDAGEPATIWIAVATEGEQVRITVRHDIPLKLLSNMDFRTDNTYGFRLLQERIRLSCGGTLEREALKEGLMNNIFTIPMVLPEEQGPVYVWY